MFATPICSMALELGAATRDGRVHFAWLLEADYMFQTNTLMSD